MSENKLILYPNLRHEISGTFGSLSDKEEQLRDWVSSTAKHRYWDSMITDLHTLYDDIIPLDELERCKKNVGKLFYDEEEATEIWKFASWFGDLTDDIGGRQPDSAYIDHPEWPKVWSGAAKVFKIMKDNDEKYDIHASWKIWNSGVTEYEGCD